jgi:putative ABC transport system ATP-binding protein
MAETVFTARALTKTYTSGEVQVQALAGLDLDTFAGEVVVLLGPSGSGKSTLLNIMGGLDLPRARSLSDGLARATTRVSRGLKCWTMRLMVPSFPLASRPSNMTSTLWPCLMTCR